MSTTFEPKFSLLGHDPITDLVCAKCESPYATYKPSYEECIYPVCPVCRDDDFADQEEDTKCY